MSSRLSFQAIQTLPGLAGLALLVVGSAQGCTEQILVIPRDAGAKDAIATSHDTGTGHVDTGPTSIASTHGSGGISCTSAHDVGGDRVCVASAGGSEFRFVEPAAGSLPSSLVVYVHGDGARAYSSDSALRALVPFAKAHHGLAVAVRAPNGCAWWQKPTQTDCTEGTLPDPDTAGVNADTLKVVLDTFRQHYDIATGRTYFYGASGGSIFLTDSFLRRFGNVYPGAYALNCGGTKPGLAFAWNSSDPQERASTKLYFTYGDQDFLKSEIEIAIPFFRAAGFRVDAQVVPNAEHCAFDAHGRAVAVFESFVSEFGD